MSPRRASSNAVTVQQPSIETVASLRAWKGRAMPDAMLPASRRESGPRAFVIKYMSGSEVGQFTPQRKT